MYLLFIFLVPSLAFVLLLQFQFYSGHPVCLSAPPHPCLRAVTGPHPNIYHAALLAEALTYCLGFGSRPSRIISFVIANSPSSYLPNPVTP